MLRGCISTLSRNLNHSMIKYKFYHGGSAGANFPMNFGNPYKVTGIFLAYFGIPLGAPWFVVWYQYWKNASEPSPPTEPSEQPEGKKKK